MKKYKVTGMSCAACQARVEKAVSKVGGVTSCSVSLLTNTMGIEGSASDKDVIKAVKDAGYGAMALEDEDDILSSGREELKKMRIRLISSVILLLILMYFSMGHMMFGFPVPPMFHEGPASGILQLVLTVLIIIINRKFFISGTKALIHLSPNMDTLIATGSGAAFIYSVVVLITGGNDLYFESASMILTLVTVGKTLEQYSKGKTTSALESIMKLAPDTCTVIRDGKEFKISTSELKKGDLVAVRPGESYPCDGVIEEGSGASDESLVTGESIPVEKAPGDSVISAAINLTGFLKIRASRVGNDTTLSGIVKMVSEAAATKAPVARLADKISSVFVPAVMGIALITFAVWMMLGAGVSYSLARAVSVLVVSCPCALGLATPVAIMVGTGLGARHGILFKSAGALQEAGKTKIAALDKTGTITSGNIKVSEIVPCEGVDKEHFVRLISAAESGSEHPVGKAVAELGGGAEATGFKAYPGFGISAVVDGHEVFAGNREFIMQHCRVDEEDAPGRIFASADGRYIGYVTVSDTIKDDSREAVSQLKKMGIYTVMLTGDSEDAAKRIASQAEVDQVVSRVTPGDKKDVIMQLKKHGRCAMTGDGINDAPALTEADTGVAIGAGTDVAIDSADIVLMSSSLKDLAAAIRLSRKTYANILQNLFWALFYNVLLIPAACGLYVSLGITMTPALGALAMSLSSVCVVLNALRLNLTDIYKTTDHVRSAVITSEIPITVREVNTMTKTMKIKGMMCEHCEARVVKTLEKIEGVTSATANHVTGEAVVNMDSEVADEVLRTAVTEQDYEVISIS